MSLSAFPANFNTSMFYQNCKVEFPAHPDPSLGAQRAHIVASVHTAMQCVSTLKYIEIALPDTMTEDDKRQLIKELCCRFTGRLDYLSEMKEEGEYVCLPVRHDSPLSHAYRIKV